MVVEVYEDARKVAEKAAVDAIATLAAAIERHGKASWALAGGTSPLAAYTELARNYGDALDWSKVTVLVGDERCVAHDHPDSNWGQISHILFENQSIGRVHTLIPQTDAGAEQGAKLYNELVRRNLMSENGEVYIDLLWLGVGEDGHTLSLFPGLPEASDSQAFVVPVHDSPKPPRDRITLSSRAAMHACKLVVFAVGASKKAALAEVRQNPQALPIGRITNAAERAGNQVLWLYDEAAGLVSGARLEL